MPACTVSANGAHHGQVANKRATTTLLSTIKAGEEER